VTEIELTTPPRIDRRPGIDQRLRATRIVGVVRCTAGELVKPDRYGPSVLELRSDRSRGEATVPDPRDDEVPLDPLFILLARLLVILMASLDRDRLRAARRLCRLRRLLRALRRRSRRWDQGRCLRTLRHGFTRSERERQARDQEREAQKGRDPGYGSLRLLISVCPSIHRWSPSRRSASPRGIPCCLPPLASQKTHTRPG